MSKITKLEVQKNNKQKVNLYLDGEYFTRLYLDTCIKYGLKSGLEIDKEKLENIIQESEKHLALNFAINYIGSALKTKKQIKNYLLKKEFDEDCIEYVIDKLIEYNYINDKNYVASYVNFYSNKYGKNKMIYNLKSKGISEKIIEHFFNENDEIAQNLGENLCYILAKKKAKNLDLNDIKNTQKLSRFLVSRGFDFDDINRAINKLKEGDI